MMKQIIKNEQVRKFLFLLVILLNSLILRGNQPDSAYLFAYGREDGSGLYFAWSMDKCQWHAIGHRYFFLRSDYSRWGTQKKMYSPFLYRVADGLWHCFWTLNKQDGAVAYTSSPDLVSWKPQAYPILMPEGNCLNPELLFLPEKGQFQLFWSSDGASQGTFSSFTSDFKNFTTAQKVYFFSSQRVQARVEGAEYSGTIHSIAWNELNTLFESNNLSAFKSIQNAERVALPVEQFKKPITASIFVNADKKKNISNLQMGVFFEDINYAADGGLYAELIQNRDFEYHVSDKGGRDPAWNSKKSWLPINTESFNIDSLSPIHVNNKHYAALTFHKQGSGIANEGFNGIAVREGEKYDFSMFVRSPEQSVKTGFVRLVAPDAKIIAQAGIKNIRREWNKIDVVLTASSTVNNARLEVVFNQVGRVDLDMISLFPQNTFKGRKNGLRADLAQLIADMHPRFVRFPGGCVAHGDGIANIYRWENTIGALEVRKPQRNLWGYHQTAGLGYFEYFQFCEDLGAEPIPVVAAGVPCQNSAHHGCLIGGQQGGIPLVEMDEYIASILNLIEYANGPANSVWGRKRAEAGHPKPFNLKYIGIGNEDLISDVFKERFSLIYKAVKAKYPEITVIGTVGPFSEGSDYVYGWKFATELGIEIVDEHYYQPPGWFLNNQDYYDKYDRSKSKVYLGEYATHVPGRHNNLEAALCEALHLINVERNGDVVTMTSYAPLLAKEGFTQWNPDLIYFNNTEVKPTVNYQVQKLFGQNLGEKYISNRVELSETTEAVKKRFAVSIVEDVESKEWIVKVVNLLPVSVGVSINKDNLSSAGAEGLLTVLKGGLEDKNILPEKKIISCSELDNYSAPAYSLSVIRVRFTR